MKQKITQLINNFVSWLTKTLTSLDGKISSFIPNPKLRKFLYIGVGSLFGFMFLIILLGLLLSPVKNNTSNGFVLNKPKIVTSSPTTQKELNETQKQILKLETEVKELRFPESKLNIPLVEKDIKI